MAVHRGGRGAGHAVRTARWAPLVNLDFLSGALDPRITFSRASTATRFNAAGLLEVVAANAPRFDYDPATLLPRGLLIEEARTNLLTASGPVSGSGWISGANVPVLTAGQAAGPDGALSLTRWARTTAALTYSYQTIAKAAAALVYTLSFYVRKDTARYVALQVQGAYPARARVTFDLDTGTISRAAEALSGFTAPSATITPAGGGLYRVTITATSDAATALDAIYAFNQNNGYLEDADSSASSSGFIGFAQLEQASTASSYIPTAGAAVTRSDDLAELSGANLTAWWSATEGTFAAEFEMPAGWPGPDGAPDRVIGSSGLNDQCWISLSGPTTLSAWNNVLDANRTGLASMAGRRTKATCAYAGSGNVQVITGDGAVPVTVTSAGVYAGVTAIRIGKGNTDATTLGGWVRGIRYWPQRLGDAQLQRITA